MPIQFDKPMSMYVDPRSVQIGQDLRDKYTKHFQADTELEQYLANLNVAMFDVDQTQAEQMRSQYGEGIEQRVSRADYENLGGSIMMDARNFIKDYTPLEKNYNTQATFQTSLQKQVADGKIMSETAALAMQRDIYNYNQDAQAKGIHQYNPSTIVEDIPNLTKYFEDNYLKGYIKHNYEETTELFSEDGVWKVKTKEGVKDYIPDQDLQQMYTNMLSDPKVQSYLSQYSELRTFDITDAQLQKNQKETSEQLTEELLKMEQQHSTMRPTAERDALTDSIKILREEIDKYSNATTEEYRGLTKQALMESVVSPVESTILTKYSGKRKVKTLIEQSYNPVYLKQLDHSLNLNRMHQRYLYDVSLKQLGAALKAGEENQENQETLDELYELYDNSGADPDNAPFLQTTVGPELSSEEGLALMLDEGYENLLEHTTTFDKTYGESSKMTGTFYTAEGEVAGNSSEDVPDGAYIVDRGNGLTARVVVKDGHILGNTSNSGRTALSTDSVDEKMESANAHVESIFSVDPATIKDPIKKHNLIDLQKAAVAQYNDLSVAASVNKTFGAIQAQEREEYAVRNKEYADYLQFTDLSLVGWTAFHDVALYDTGAGAEAGPLDVQEFMMNIGIGVGNGLDVYTLNGADVSKIDHRGEVTTGLSMADIPSYDDNDVFEPRGGFKTKDLEEQRQEILDRPLEEPSTSSRSYRGVTTTNPGYSQEDKDRDLADINYRIDNDIPQVMHSGMIIPGIAQITTPESGTKAQATLADNIENTTNGFVATLGELHKGDFYGNVIWTPEHTQKAYEQNVVNPSIAKREELESHIDERTEKVQQEFVQDVFLKGTYLTGLDGIVPPTSPEKGAKGALTNTAAYNKYLKTPYPSQQVYGLFDPKLDTDVQDYQLFYENGEFNVNLVDEEGTVLPPLTLEDIFGTNKTTGALNAYLVPGSMKSEIQIPPVNKRGLSAVYKVKDAAILPPGRSGTERVFIPYETLPATVPKIKERLYNEGLQYIGQQWSAANRSGRDLDLILNPLLMNTPLEFETDAGNHTFTGKVRFSPLDGKVYYLDIHNNPIPGSGKDYHDWAGSLPKNTLNIIDQFFNK